LIREGEKPVRLKRDPVAEKKKVKAGPKKEFGPLLTRDVPKTWGRQKTPERKEKVEARIIQLKKQRGGK